MKSFAYEDLEIVSAVEVLCVEKPRHVVGAESGGRVHTGRGPLSLIAVAGALERCPSDLEQESLLRVHTLRVLRVQTEEPGVEELDPL